MQLILVRGLPGAGKSTFARKHYPDLLHVEADMLRMSNFMYIWEISETVQKYKACEEIAETCLKNNADCVVVNIFITHRNIIPYEKLAKKYGAELTVITMKTQYISEHNVPLEAMQKMKEAWEPYEGESIVE